MEQSSYHNQTRREQRKLERQISNVKIEIETLETTVFTNGQSN